MDNAPNLNADELSAYASAKHLAGVSDEEIREDIVRMLRSDGWKEAAIAPMINEIARRTKEARESPKGSPKASQNATTAMLAALTQLTQMMAPITSRLEALEQRGKPSPVTPRTPEGSSAAAVTPPLMETSRRTKYPHPELFDGERAKYVAFRYKTKAKLHSDYDGASDRTKIAYVVSRCSERASDVILPWAEQYQEHCSIEDLWHFLNQQYDDPHLKAKALDQLSNLRQGKRAIRDYHMEFNRLELQSGIRIDDTQKKSMFTKGLSAELQRALALVSESLSFEEFAREATRVSDNLYRVSLASRSRKEFNLHQGRDPHRQNKQSRVRTPSPPENMDWEPTKVSKASARDKRSSSGQIECYSCGKKGHMARYCEKSAKPKSTKVSRVAQREPSPACECHRKALGSSDLEDSGKD
jgi:hypothetical protein